jgi:hypothetical protein
LARERRTDRRINVAILFTGIVSVVVFLYFSFRYSSDISVKIIPPGAASPTEFIVKPVGGGAVSPDEWGECVVPSECRGRRGDIYDGTRTRVLKTIFFPWYGGIVVDLRTVTPAS